MTENNNEEDKEKQYHRELKKFLTPVLRRATYRWSARNQALTNARVERGLYMCAMCQGDFKKDEVCIDHIEPVVSVTEGFTNWHDYVVRMFPSVDGFQVLCEVCHDQKTMVEDSLRATYNAKRKEEKKRLKQEEKERKKQEKLLAKGKK